MELGRTHELYRAPSSISALPAAEQLSELEARTYAEQLSRKKSAKGRLASAWAHTEWAMCEASPHGDDWRRDQLALAQNLAADAEQSESLDTWFKARLFASYLPLFAARIGGRSPSSDDTGYLYASLGTLLSDYSDDCQRLSRPLPSETAGVTLQALAARSREGRYVMYQASPREEASHLQPYNHDGYFLTELGEKLPIQVKTQETAKVYDASIATVVVSGLLRTIHRHQHRMRWRAPMFGEVEVEDYTRLITLMEREADGTISPDELLVLNRATANVLSFAQPRMPQENPVAVPA